MKVIADDKIPFLRGVLEAEGIDVTYLPGKAITSADVRDADALIVRTRTKCNEALLSGSSVQFLASATIGFDHIDTGWVERAGIAWTNAPGCNAQSVAQYMASVLLHLAVSHHFALRGKTLGIVGVGNVGKKVAAMAQALGVKLLLNDPPRARAEGQAGFVGLDKIIAQADIITFHVPLIHNGIDKTFHLADETFLARLRPHQIVINASRGEVVDNAALKKALQTHSIQAAVLDVWENEPEIDRELLALTEYATPHIAGYSTDGKANGTGMSIRALARHFHLGEPLASWQPQDVPLPECRTVTLEPEETLEAELLAAVSASYDVMRDSQLLKSSPETFEKQRGSYPLRREFPVYSIAGGSSEAKRILQALGFNLKDQ